MASLQAPFDPPIRAQEPATLPIVPTQRWSVVGKKRLTKSFVFETIEKRNDFMSQVLKLEAECGHSSEMFLSELEVQMKVWTRSSDSLTDLDKEYARTVDAIFRDLTVELPTVYLRHTVG